MTSATKRLLFTSFNGKLKKRVTLNGISLQSLRPVLVVIEVVLVIALASLMADITWQFFSEEDVVSGNVIGRSPARNQAVNSDLYPQLNELYLFGQPLVEAATSEQAFIDPYEIPRSRLQARITGIISHPDESRSLAIIESNRQEGSYRIGDRIHRTGADIQMIYPDRVVVDNNGQQEALLLYPNEPDRPMPVNAVSQTQDVSQVREQLLTNPQSLLELISISPVREDGELRGYRINPRRNPEFFNNLGLQPNDLAVSINGSDLTNNQEAMQVFAELPNAQHIVLTVEREQQLVNIEISL